jgi:hypothetical protein
MIRKKPAEEAGALLLGEIHRSLSLVHGIFLTLTILHEISSPHSDMNTPQSLQHQVVGSDEKDEACQVMGKMESQGQSALPVLDCTNQFPFRLHQMLKGVEDEGLDSIISWLPGKSQNTFKVHNKDEFMDRIMPRFFKQIKYKSFLRQLNLWGFDRILDSGPLRGSYRHPLFVKDQPELYYQMKRTKVKGTMPRESGATASNSRVDGPLTMADSPQLLFAGHLDGSSNISLDTIEYDRMLEYDIMLSNLPVAAELSRMYADDMRYVLLGVQPGGR